jgi:AraC-like DNA-binding protein
LSGRFLRQSGIIRLTSELGPAHAGLSRCNTEKTTPPRPANMSLSGTRILPPTAIDGDVARVGPILTLPDVLTELGVEPRRAFSKARVQASLFGHPDNVIDYQALGRLLATCVDLTGCGHFGLLLGARATIGSFSYIGELMRHSPTVGEALRVLLLHLYLHDRIAVPVLLRPKPGTVLFGYSTTTTGMEAVDQLYDGAIAIAFKLLRELCGPPWKPSAVQFAYRPRSGTDPYRRVFNAPIRFDAEVSGVVFSDAWLERPVVGADPAARARISRIIEQFKAANPVRFTLQVRRVVHQLVLAGALSSANVAGLFAISERALRLRLQADGTNLHEIVEETRGALAKQLMLDTRLSIAEVSAALGYSGPPGFSRAFRKWSGMSPLQWRGTHRPKKSR